MDGSQFKVERSCVCSCLFFFASRSVMRRNRNEDTIQDVVWKTIMRGSSGAKSKNAVQVRQSKALAPKVVPAQPFGMRFLWGTKMNLDTKDQSDFFWDTK